MKKPKMKDGTRKKWDNFWYYYKIHVLIGAFLLFMAVVFIKDMLSKIEYDYNVAFVSDYMMADEDNLALQKYFEENGEDLNGDGEVHVQIQNYSIPSEDSKGYDPQMLMASQTKLTVDMQEGTSMIFFLSEQNFEKFKESGVLPENREDYVDVKACGGYAECGSPQSIEDMFVGLRIVEGTKMADDEESIAYQQASERLFDKFVQGSGQ